jgi:hypothetical protein
MSSLTLVLIVAFVVVMALYLYVRSNRLKKGRK